MARKWIVIVLLFGMLAPGHALAVDCKKKGYIVKNDWTYCTKKCLDELMDLYKQSGELNYALTMAAKLQPMVEEVKGMALTREHVLKVKKARGKMTTAIKAYRKCIKTISLPNTIRMK